MPIFGTMPIFLEPHSILGTTLIFMEPHLLFSSFSIHFIGSTLPILNILLVLLWGYPRILLTPASFLPLHPLTPSPILSFLTPFPTRSHFPHPPHSSMRIYSTSYLHSSLTLYSLTPDPLLSPSSKPHSILSSHLPLNHFTKFYASNSLMTHGNQ
jgi:hypothetical protein